ncbi:hypothetical protein YQE_08622, partial [Dendroctonus ponderosae]
MEKENQPEPQNVQIKKEFKLRSSLKRSVRNISELKDDSMESPDETVGGLRRRVSFAASSTVKPFVNDPVQNTIWDNTYEEIVDHTDSNNTLSTASSVIGTVQSSKEIKIVMSCQETPNDQGKKRKCVMSKTITEVVDMNYTCQQHKVNLQVTDTNKTVNGSNINRTIYPDIGMDFTCVFPEKQDANFETRANMKEKSVNTDMEFTCLFPAQEDVNSTSIIKEQSKFLNEDMSLTCVFPGNKELNIDNSGDGMTTHPNADMSLTCVFPASTLVNTENNAKQTTNISKNMSLPCVIRSGDVTTQNLSSNRNLVCVSTNTEHHVSKDDSIEKMCSIVTNEKLIADENLISINKCLESSIGSNKDANRILNNVEMKIYHPSRFTAITMQKCKDTLNYAKDVCDKFRAYLREFVPTKHHVSKLEKNVKRLSLLRASSASSVSLSNESDEDLQDAEMDNELVVVSKHQQIMEVFQNTDVIYLKLISFQDNGYTFSTYFSAVKIAVTIHPDDGRVVEMSNLMLSLGICFDMLSLLHQVQMIMEKCIDFVYDFVKAQREFKTLKMDSDGVVQFNIMHTNPPIFWTMQFQMSSPETILQDSLKVSSKWSPINKTHFESIFLNVQPGTDCIKQVAIDVFEFFKRTELRKLKCNN